MVYKKFDGSNFWHASFPLYTFQTNISIWGINFQKGVNYFWAQMMDAELLII